MGCRGHRFRGGPDQEPTNRGQVKGFAPAGAVAGLIEFAGNLRQVVALQLQQRCHPTRLFVGLMFPGV